VLGDYLSCEIGRRQLSVLCEARCTAALTT
jgi:hypothetical protein